MNRARPPADSSLSEEVNRGYAEEHEDGAKRVADDRSARHASALRREDVEHGLPDEKTAAEHRDRRMAADNAIKKDDREDEHLAQLQQRVGGHYLTRACSKSATMSSAASMPVDTRTVPGPTPSSARSAGVRPRCDVISGYEIVVSTPPRLAAKDTISKRFIIRCTAGRPPARSKASMPPAPSGTRRLAVS